MGSRKSLAQNHRRGPYDHRQSLVITCYKSLVAFSLRKACHWGKPTTCLDLSSDKGAGKMAITEKKLGVSFTARLLCAPDRRSSDSQSAADGGLYHSEDFDFASKRHRPIRQLEALPLECGYQATRTTHARIADRGEPYRQSAPGFVPSPARGR